MRSSVGVFGGAFDPPHVGHVALAAAGIAHFHLDRLLVRVVADPGHKDVATAPEIRLRLAELAFAPLDGAEVSLDPFERTVDSLESLGLVSPVFLVGADEFASFPRWKDPARVLELARLGVATRPGVAEAELRDVRESLAQPERVTFFPIARLAVSSSGIRALAARGEPIDGLVPPAVAVEMTRLHLYAADGAGGDSRVQ